MKCEMVSSNDSRAVEFDQFLSELISTVVAQRRPMARLIGQGLSGTGRHPHRSGLLPVNGPPVASMCGRAQLQPHHGARRHLGHRMRASASYVDQSAGKTGVAGLCAARLPHPDL